MQSVVQFVQNHTRKHARPWLVVGKGPSSDYVSRVDPDKYNVFTLNHACKVITPTLAHFVDIEAFDDCRDTLMPLSCFVAMPWHPHESNHPQAATLLEYPQLAPLLGRLCTYNSTTAPRSLPRGKWPILRLRFFSATVAFNILLAAGVTDIHSIGVDGGSGYGGSFDQKTRLKNGRKSFDVQTPLIKDAVKRVKARWTKLAFKDP